MEPVFLWAQIGVVKRPRRVLHRGSANDDGALMKKAARQRTSYGSNSGLRHFFLLRGLRELEGIN